MRVLRDEGGSVSQVEVARWPNPRGDEPCRLWRIHLAQKWEGVVLRYDFGQPQPKPVSWDEVFGVKFEVNEGRIHPHYGTMGSLDAESIRRIRWAALAVGFVDLAPFPLFRGTPMRCDPVPILVDRRGDDPEVAAEVKEAAEEVRRLSGKAGRMSLRTRMQLLDRLRRIADLVRPRYPGEEGDPGPAIRLVPVLGDPRTGTTFHVRMEVGHYGLSPGLLLERETTDLEARWRELWSADPAREGYLGPRKPFAFLSEAAFEGWAVDPFRIEPGELSMADDEVNLFRMLGEPLPLALPGPELVAWAEQREAEGGRDQGSSP